MTHDEALALLRTGASIFLTGQPGSGKTHTVNRYVRELQRQGIDYAYTASTGIAATHGYGVTIHAWSGIGVREALTRRDLDLLSTNRRLASRIEKTKVLIIDEISMLPARALSLVDAVCRHIRGQQAPFGGLQVVLVGDFFQLPPVVRRDRDESMLQLAGGSDAFGAEFAHVVVRRARHQRLRSSIMPASTRLLGANPMMVGILARQTRKVRILQPRHAGLAAPGPGAGRRGIRHGRRHLARPARDRLCQIGRHRDGVGQRQPGAQRGALLGGDRPDQQGADVA